MKKIFFVTALLLVAASSAFSATSLTMDLATAGKQGATLYGAKSSVSATTSPVIGKTSTGVGLGMLVSATGTGYAVIAQHKNGTKEFGSSYDSTSIFSCPVPANAIGTPVLTVPSAITSADFVANTWTSM